MPNQQRIDTEPLGIVKLWDDHPVNNLIFMDFTESTENVAIGREKSAVQIQILLAPGTVRGRRLIQRLVALIGGACNCSRIGTWRMRATRTLAGLAGCLSSMPGSVMTNLRVNRTLAGLAGCLGVMPRSENASQRRTPTPKWSSFDLGRCCCQWL